MEKMLVMGGSYFIGPHIIDALKDDYDLYVLNRGTNPLNDSKVTELRADRNDKTALKNTLSGLSFDHVIDISCFTRDQAEKLLTAVDKDALKHYLFISTAAVYDFSSKAGPFKEQDAMDNGDAKWDYAKNKIEAEDYLNDVLSDNDLTIFRPPFIYGEDNYILRERLIFHLIDNDLPVYIPADNNRIQFVYVRDLAEQVKAAIKGVIPPGTYNVANESTQTFEEWVTLCEKAAGKKTVKIFIDPRETDMKATDIFPFPAKDLLLDVSKIKAKNPVETPMETGLKNAYRDYQKIKDTIAMPEKMQVAREALDKKLK